MQDSNKIQLSGFNNLTKTLGLNMYNVSYVCAEDALADYVRYINEAFHSSRLTSILQGVARIIGANVLNVATADYQPSGASTTLLISEESPALAGVNNRATPGPLPETVVAHLDKSHLTAHTYPENHPAVGINIIRTDMDVSTCGRISPLKALNYLVHLFKPEVAVLDYRVRGFTRSGSGDKVFIDHSIDSIQNFIGTDQTAAYQYLDHNLVQQNLFHTRMRKQKVDVEEVIFPGKSAAEVIATREIEAALSRELAELFGAIPDRHLI
ncbi:MAG: adenosylmethionine decarboxylase [Thiotrichales bacterium]|nr:adenosylmethionine decarboxylase [Thiotrichales bacterium]